MYERGDGGGGYDDDDDDDRLYVPVHVMKACTASGVKIQFQIFLTSSLDGVNSQPYAPAPFPLEKELPYLFNSRLGGPQRLSGRFWEKKNLLPLPRFEPRIVVNIVTTVSQPLIIIIIIIIISLKKNLEAVPGKHSIDSLQKTAILGTSHIIRKVLQCET